jgi:hypothetical protein
MDLTACSSLIIDDTNYSRWQNGEAHECGNEQRYHGTLPRRTQYGSLPFGVTSIPTIPMEEWPDRIADMERTKSTLKHIWADVMPKPVWDQDGLGYCHGFSAVMCLAVQIFGVQGLPYVELSSSSVAGRVTGWRNRGAAIDDDLEVMVKYGACTTEFCPMTTANRADCKPGWEENALKYRVLRWYDGQSRNLLQQGSLLLTNKPTGVGLNYWGHAVTDMVLRDINKSLRATDPERYGIEFLNSWTKNWGDYGWGVRVGSRKYADQFYAIYEASLAV